MSLQPTRTYVIPEQTARIAKAAFPKGTLCLQIYDHLGTILQDQDFADLFSRRGQPAATPFRLALVTLLQFLAAIRSMNRPERVIETLRAALNALATVVPAWVQATVPADWLARYGARAEDSRCPQTDAERMAYVAVVGRDGYGLFEALHSETAPRWLRERPAVEILRQVWIQNFLPVYGGGARWRDKGDLPPAAQYINSPYDTEARYAKILDRTLCQVILKQVVKRLSYRILSLESTTNPEGAGDE